MQELICWLNTPQFHWIHQGHVATSSLVCNLLAGCWCWQGDTRGPKLLMRVIAQQRLGSPGPQLWLPASVSSCTRWKKLDHGLHGTVSPLIETTQFTVELTKTFCLWGSNTFSIFQQSLSGSIERVCLRSDYDEVPWYQLRAFSVSFLILWLISRWARERQKPYFCWNWF